MPFVGNPSPMQLVVALPVLAKRPIVLLLEPGSSPMVDLCATAVKATSRRMPKPHNKFHLRFSFSFELVLLRKLNKLIESGSLMGLSFISVARYEGHMCGLSRGRFVWKMGEFEFPRKKDEKKQNHNSYQ